MSSLTFCDFFAGVGGVRLGLERAGHRCVWSCEIDPFARAVYGHRFGREPEAGDINAVKPEEIPDADLWTGGFPCQDVSTAGRRAGIGEGTRSGLVWKFLELAEIKKPKWILFENVPGLLSIDGGLGLARLLHKMAELGWVGCYRVLDARHMGVPQRRRRVFILARRAGDGVDPREILLEPEGVRGDLEARGAEGAEVAGTLGGGSGSRGWCNDLDRSGAFIVGIPDPAYTTTTTKCGTISQREAVDTLVVGAFNSTAESGNGGNGGNGWDEKVSPPVKVGSGIGIPSPPAIVYQQHGSDVGPIGALRRGHGDVQSGVPFTLAFDTAQITSNVNRTKVEPNGPSPTLAASGASRPTVAYAISSDALDRTGEGASGKAGDRAGLGIREEESPSLRTRANAVAYCVESPGAKQSGGPEVGIGVKIDESYSLVASSGKEHAVAYPIAFQTGPGSRSVDVSSEVAPTLKSSGHTPHPPGVVAFSIKDHGADAGPEAPTLRAMGHSGSHENGGGQVGVMCWKESQSGTRFQEEHGTLDANKGSRRQEGILLPDMVVRRLTPKECERLQGMPDDWTNVPWKGKPSAPDSKRYKAIGNSVAEPVLFAIGRRLQRGY